MSSGGNLEGTVYKWTNYWGGWQPRWLILQNGVLSYYNSADEVDKGCRASIKISASDIIAYPTDNTRFDIVVQSEQRWYLKTTNAAERQAWIIALGTSKASSNDLRLHKEQDSLEAHSELRTCMSEVRLFCDLLVQQAVHVKEEAQKDTPDIQKIADNSTLLSTTCDTFLVTLGRCLSISETVFEMPGLPGRMITRSQSQTDQAALPVLGTPKSRHKKRHGRSACPTTPTSPVHSPFSTKVSPVQSAPPDTLTRLHNDDPITTKTNNLKLTTEGTGLSSDSATKTVLTLNIPKPKLAQTHSMNSDGATTQLDGKEPLLTFFSAMLHSFSDITLEEDGGIPTIPFLSACEGIIPFLDTIGSTAFAPVKMDFMGNISKLRTKYRSDTSKYKTLQAILTQEIRTSTTKVRNSATDALMWLKRGLRFIQKFLLNFKNGENNLTIALNNAYSDTLKVYHGWVVKGIFALAVKAAPYPKDFIRALSPTPDHADDCQFTTYLMKDIDQYTTAMDVILNLVDNFYQQCDLESSAVV